MSDLQDIIPTTHLSRFVAVLASLLGIVAASLLTASLGNALLLSPQVRPLLHCSHAHSPHIFAATVCLLDRCLVQKQDLLILCIAVVLCVQEWSATLVLNREKARWELQQKSATMIAYWWRRKKGRLNRRQRRIVAYDLKKDFRRTKMDTQIEVEDCAGMSKKIDQISRRSKYVERALDAIADKLWMPDVSLCW